MHYFPRCSFFLFLITVSFFVRGQNVPWHFPDPVRLYSAGWDNTRTHAIHPPKPVSAIPLFFALTDAVHPRVYLPHSGGMSSPYGPRWGRNHNGVDIVLRPGHEVYCVFDGIVRYARRNSGGYGNLVIVRHYNGLETYYAHLDDISVSANQKVSAGDVLGHGGSTGHSSGPHLHFEVRIIDYPVNPELIFDFVNRRLKVSGYVIHDDILFLGDAALLSLYPALKSGSGGSVFTDEKQSGTRRGTSFGNMGTGQ